MKKLTLTITFVFLLAAFAGCFQDTSPSEAKEPGVERILGEWELDAAYTEAVTGVSMRDVFGTSLGENGSGLSLTAEGNVEYYIGVLSAKGSWTADGDTGRYVADVLEFPNEINVQIPFCEFKESPESPVYIVMDYEGYTLYWKPYGSASTEHREKTPIEDIAYHLELSAAGKEYRDMDSERRDGLLREYRELIQGYQLLARESADGASAYILGVYEGNAEDSPLNGMYCICTDGRGETQLLYREADLAAVERALAETETPNVGYLIENSYFSFFDQGSVFLIQPKEGSLFLDETINRYLHMPYGPEYIRDAASRGILLNNAEGPVLCVYRVCEPYGEIFENIPLTKKDVEAIQAEERVMLTEGFGFTADLTAEEYSELFTERGPIPTTVLELAVEHCDYRFNDPSAIRADISEARLNFDGQDVPLYAAETELPRLREILQNARLGYVTADDYGAKLTLSFVGGEKLTLFKGKGSDTIIFGSYGGYFLGEAENREFWAMFGLDADEIR